MAVGSNSAKVESLKTPISDGVIMSKEMTGLFKDHYVSITFYSDAQCTKIVSKSDMAGTVVFSATINGDEYGVMQVNSDSNGILTLGGTNELVGVMSGSYRFAKAELNITDSGGATHAILTVSSFKG